MASKIPDNDMKSEMEDSRLDVLKKYIESIIDDDSNVIAESGKKRRNFTSARHRIE